MIPILLLARSFTRQNRWLLLAFVLWPFLLGAFVRVPHHAAGRADVSEIVQQEVFYGVAVVGFLAASAIYNEKRSRRIIGVLAKGVSRAQYLLAFVAGAGCFAIVYFAAIGASIFWLQGYSRLLLSATFSLLIRGVVASLWMASLALLFSTFLFPFIAAALAGMAAFAPFAFSHPNVVLAPVASLLGNGDPISLVINLAALVSALAESAVFLTLAAFLFARRDVTVSIE